MSDDGRLAGPTIRPLRDEDLPGVAALNAANVPAVGALDEDRIALFRAEATWLVVVDRGELLATFVGLREGLPYASPNYRWFADRHERFAYVDRIAVAAEARGAGVARRLYERWFADAAAADVELVCAEVNVDPPNPQSLAFHERLGFATVAEVQIGDRYRVAMLERRIRDHPLKAATSSR